MGKAVKDLATSFRGRSRGSKKNNNNLINYVHSQNSPKDAPNKTSQQQETLCQF